MTDAFTLVKVSYPGWEKHFYDINDVEEELAKHICGQCLYDCGEDLEGMLNSSCGLEFEIRG